VVLGPRGDELASFHATLKSAVSVTASAETITLPCTSADREWGTTGYVGDRLVHKAVRRVWRNYAPGTPNAIGTKASAEGDAQCGVLKFAARSTRAEGVVFPRDGLPADEGRCRRGG